MRLHKVEWPSHPRAGDALFYLWQREGYAHGLCQRHGWNSSKKMSKRKSEIRPRWECLVKAKTFLDKDSSSAWGLVSNNVFEYIWLRSRRDSDIKMDRERWANGTLPFSDVRCDKHTHTHTCLQLFYDQDVNLCWTYLVRGTQISFE